MPQITSKTQFRRQNHSSAQPHAGRLWPRQYRLLLPRGPSQSLRPPIGKHTCTRSRSRAKGKAGTIFYEKFDKIKLYEIIQDNEDEISYELNFRLFELLDEESYIIKAYNQVIHLSKQMNEELQNKFLSYHIQKGIIDNYKLLFPKKD